MKRKLSPHERRAVAVAAVCALPTVHRYLVGLPIRETSRLRIERALEALRLTDERARDGVPLAAESGRVEAGHRA